MFICGRMEQPLNWAAFAIVWWVCRIPFRSRHSWEKTTNHLHDLHSHSYAVLPMADRNPVGFVVRHYLIEGNLPYMIMPRQAGLSFKTAARKCKIVSCKIKITHKIRPTYVFYTHIHCRVHHHAPVWKSSSHFNPNSPRTVGGNPVMAWKKSWFCRIVFEVLGVLLNILIIVYVCTCVTNQSAIIYYIIYIYIYIM